MKKIIFLLLVIGFMFSLSYAQSPVVMTPVGFTAVVGDGNDQHPVDADINLLWEDPMAAVGKGSNSQYVWGGGSAGVESMWRVAHRFTQAQLKAMGADEMQIEAVWLKGASAITSEGFTSVTAHVFSGVKYNEEMGTGAFGAADTVSSLMVTNLGVPTYSSTPFKPTASSGTWVGFGVPQIPIPAEDDLWIVFTIRFVGAMNPIACNWNPPASAARYDNYYSFAPVGADGQFKNFFDINDPRALDTNYDSLGVYIEDSDECQEIAFCMEMDLSYIKEEKDVVIPPVHTPHHIDVTCDVPGCTPWGPDNPCDDENCPICFPDDGDDHDPATCDLHVCAKCDPPKTCPNAGHVCAICEVTTKCGHKCTKCEQTETCGHICDICPETTKCGHICEKCGQTDPCDDEDCEICKPGDGEPSPVGRASSENSRSIFYTDSASFVPQKFANFRAAATTFRKSRALEDQTPAKRLAGYRLFHNEETTPFMDVATTPVADTTSGVYSFPSVNPENNAIHDYYIQTVLNTGTKAVPVYAYSPKVQLTVVKGNPQIELPWSVDFSQHTQVRLPGMWRFNNSESRFYMGDTLRADTPAMVAAKPTWIGRTMPAVTYATTPGHLTSAGSITALPTGTNQLRINNYIISPALTYPAASELTGGKKVYFAFNIQATGLAANGANFPYYSVYVSKGNTIASLELIPNSLDSLNTAGWRGKVFEIPESLNLAAGDRFHVAVKHHAAHNRAGVNIDDLFVGVVDPAAFTKTAPTNLLATSDKGVVTLNWTAPANTPLATASNPTGLAGYYISRKSTYSTTLRVIAFVPANVTTYKDVVTINGDYTYSIVAQYKLPLASSEAITKDIKISDMDNLVFAPFNVNAVYSKETEGNDINVAWRVNDIATSAAEYSQTGGGTTLSGYGFEMEGAPNTWSEAIQANRYDPEDLKAAGLDGQFIRSIQSLMIEYARVYPAAAPGTFFDETNYQSNYQAVLYIWEGGTVDANNVWKPAADGSDLVHSQLVDMRSASSGWNHVYLSRLHKIDASKTLVVGVGHRGLRSDTNTLVKVYNYAMAVINSPVKPGKSNLACVDGSWRLFTQTNRDYAIYMYAINSAEAAASGTPIARKNSDDLIQPLNGSGKGTFVDLSFDAIEMPDRLVENNALEGVTYDTITYDVYGAADGTTPVKLTETPQAERTYSWAGKEDGFYHLQVASQNNGGESNKVNMYYYAGETTIDLGEGSYALDFESEKFPPKGWSSYSIKPTVTSSLGWFRYGNATNRFAGVRTPSGYPGNNAAVDTVMFVSPRFSAPADLEEGDISIEYQVRKNGSAAECLYRLALSIDGTDYKDFKYILTNAKAQAMGNTDFDGVKFTEYWLDLDDDPIDISDLIKGKDFYLAFISDVGRSTNTGIDIDDFKVLNQNKLSDGETPAPVFITELSGNYPNPFNPTTTIKFSMAKESPVTIEIFNIKGQKVKTLVNERKEAGNYTVEWTGKDNYNKNVSTGIYFYRMKTDNYTETKKMIMLK